MTLPSIQLRSPLVLVVDDTEMCLELASIILVQAGATVLTASNGETAVSMAAAYAFDLIYMDIQMPKMNGFEAARRIRLMGGWNAIVPIVALSASRLDGPLERWEANGITSCFIKPYQPAELALNYDSWCRRSELTAASQKAVRVTTLS